MKKFIKDDPLYILEDLEGQVKTQKAYDGYKLRTRRLMKKQAELLKQFPPNPIGTRNLEYTDIKPRDITGAPKGEDIYGGGLTPLGKGTNQGF